MVISAALKPRSLPAHAILLARSYETIVLSDAVEAELRRVIARPKFRLCETELAAIIDAIVTTAERFDPGVIVTDCRDPKDNKYSNWQTRHRLEPSSAAVTIFCFCIPGAAWKS